MIIYTLHHFALQRKSESSSSLVHESRSLELVRLLTEVVGTNRERRLIEELHCSKSSDDFMPPIYVSYLHLCVKND